MNRSRRFARSSAASNRTGPVGSSRILVQHAGYTGSVGAALDQIHQSVDVLPGILFIKLMEKVSEKGLHAQQYRLHNGPLAPVILNLGAGELGLDCSCSSITWSTKLHADGALEASLLDRAWPPMSGAFNAMPSTPASAARWRAWVGGPGRLI